MDHKNQNPLVDYVVAVLALWAALDYVANMFFVNQTNIANAWVFIWLFLLSQVGE